MNKNIKIIEDKEQLIDWFKSGFKKKSETGWLEQNMKSLLIHFQKLKINIFHLVTKER